MCKFQLTVITLLLLLLLLLPGPGVCVPVVAGENNVQLIYRKLEEALTQNSTLLFQLQKLFLFNRKPKSCYNAKVIVEVGTLNRTARRTGFHKCTNYRNYECEYGNWTSGYNNYIICPEGLGELESSQLLLGYQTTSLLQSFDPLFYYMITAPFIIDSNVNINSDRSGCGKYGLNEPVPDITLKLFLDTIDILPLREELSEAEMILLSLVSI